ncbi:MAG: hypothetical protein H0W16_07595 [Actinobacteria bacterium]|nr:hypothetical protein [Actinomycetota bacterium]
MRFSVVIAIVVGLVIGVPLLIVGLAALGPVGWIGAAVVLPLVTLGVILRLGRARPGDGVYPPDS